MQDGIVDSGDATLGCNSAARRANRAANACLYFLQKMLTCVRFQLYATYGVHRKNKTMAAMHAMDGSSLFCIMAANTAVPKKMFKEMLIEHLTHLR